MGVHIKKMASRRRSRMWIDNCIGNYDEWKEELDGVSTIEEFRKCMEHIEWVPAIPFDVAPREIRDVRVPQFVDGHLEAYMALRELNWTRFPIQGFSIRVTDDFNAMFPEVYRTATNLEWLKEYLKDYIEKKPWDYAVSTATGIDFVEHAIGISNKYNDKQKIILLQQSRYYGYHNFLYSRRYPDPDYAFQERESPTVRIPKAVLRGVMGHDDTRSIKSTVLSFLFEHKGEPVVGALATQLIRDGVITRDEILNTYHLITFTSTHVHPRLRREKILLREIFPGAVKPQLM